MKTHSFSVRRQILLAATAAMIAFLVAAPARAQTVTFLHSFVGGTNDAGRVTGTPVIAGDTIFGVGSIGGTNNQGVIFAISTNGANVQILHSFTGTGSDGCCPDGSIVLAGDTLYGAAGGVAGYGQIYSVGTNGANYQTLHDFSLNENDGDQPFQATSLLIIDDTLYGVTSNGGSNRDGVVYSISTNGANFQVLHSFSGASDGEQPGAGLTAVGDTLYGMTQTGGSYNQGVVFSVSTNGSAFQVVHTFTGSADGGRPEGSSTLVAATLYGTASTGGSEGYGTLFQILTTDNSFSVVHSFGTVGNDGTEPNGDLTQVGDTLYGTTYLGGKNNQGTIFSISADQTDYGTVYSFSTAAESGYSFDLNSGLTLVGTNLFGFTNQGGSADRGTLFTLELGPNGSQPVNSNTLVFAFSNVVQNCKYKTKVDKKTHTTIDETNCTLSVDFVVTNPGTNTSAAFVVGLWAGQGSTFDAGVGPFPLAKKIKALKEGKSDVIKVKGSFSESQSGSFIFATDSNLNVLASIQVE